MNAIVSASTGFLGLVSALATVFITLIVSASTSWVDAAAAVGVATGVVSGATGTSSSEENGFNLPKNPVTISILGNLPLIHSIASSINPESMAPMSLTDSMKSNPSHHALAASIISPSFSPGRLMKSSISTIIEENISSNVNESKNADILSPPNIPTTQERPSLRISTTLKMAAFNPAVRNDITPPIMSPDLNLSIDALIPA